MGILWGCQVESVHCFEPVPSPVFADDIWFHWNTASSECEVCGTRVGTFTSEAMVPRSPVGQEQEFLVNDRGLNVVWDSCVLCCTFSSAMLWDHCTLWNIVYAWCLIKNCSSLWPIFLFLWHCEITLVLMMPLFFCMSLCIRLTFFPIVHTTVMLPECFMHWQFSVYWYGTQYCSLKNSCMVSLLWSDERGKSFWHAGSMDFYFYFNGIWKWVLLL